MRVVFQGELNRYIFVGNDVSCLYLRNGDGSAPVFVTFDYWRHARDDVEIYAEHFCRKHGFNQFHVFPVANNWFQTREMEEVFGAINRMRAPGARVVTYGGSMGGFAALQFAKRLGADTAIAISPQVRGDPSKTPHDRRWPEVASITWLYDDLDLSGVRRVFAVCDPLCRDDREQLRHLPISATLIPVVGGGHSPDAALVGWGLMEGFLLALLNDNYRLDALRRKIRPCRRGLDYYLANINEHLTKRGKAYRVSSQVPQQLKVNL